MTGQASGMLHPIEHFARAGLVAALSWLLPAAPAAAHPLYDTERIIPYQQMECVGTAAGACYRIHSRLTRVGVDRTERLTLSCPKAYPYVIGWDAKRHEHLELTVALPSLPSVRPSTSGKLHSLTVLAANKADAAGSFRLYVGCAKRPFAGAGFMRAAQASPSRLARPPGGRS